MNPKEQPTAAQPDRGISSDSYRATISAVPDRLGSTTVPSPGPIVDPRLGSSTGPILEAGEQS